ncbi:hypothetical protein SARC_03810 [Sphaeroforma arctica JP610]|uniref:Adipose-secreted signaling protein n=1 Tax=Sphaeroforma arctica JP610 TaxID=667725 RepID=A0A0L0G546_9EUKA|nr:hypothetical protein SARC_03810 [Sphaeroforma arctica JP610]KNC83946.1 hypothetical protein SARC_03810 [Sphaeroforma arctica JP610]|eukprot:XP_014157848.1 hypothetical protein SARC_03810 [Sphaeroforma arctica JP610]
MKTAKVSLQDESGRSEVKHVSFNRVKQRQSTDHTNIRQVQWPDVLRGSATLSLGLLKTGCTYKMRFTFGCPSEDTSTSAHVEMIGPSGVSFDIGEDEVHIERADTPTEDTPTEDTPTDTPTDSRTDSPTDNPTAKDESRPVTSTHTHAHASMDMNAGSDAKYTDTHTSQDEHTQRDGYDPEDSHADSSRCPCAGGPVFVVTIATEYEGKISQVQRFLVTHEGREHEVAVTLLCNVMRKGSGTPSLKPGVRLVGCASHDSDYETEWTGF